MIQPCVSDWFFIHRYIKRPVGTSEGRYSTYAVDPIVAVAVEIVVAVAAVVVTAVAAVNPHLVEQARSRG